MHHLTYICFYLEDPIIPYSYTGIIGHWAISPLTFQVLTNIFDKIKIFKFLCIHSLGFYTYTTQR